MDTNGLSTSGDLEAQLAPKQSRTRLTTEQRLQARLEAARREAAETARQLDAYRRERAEVEEELKAVESSKALIGALLLIAARSSDTDARSQADGMLALMPAIAKSDKDRKRLERVTQILGRMRSDPDRYRRKDS